MDEAAFQIRCSRAMEVLFDALSAAADQHDFDVDQGNGTITVEFEQPRAKFVVSPNSPVRQIWVSALTRSFKLEWNDAREAFVLPESGATLLALMGEAIGTQLGEQVVLG